MWKILRVNMNSLTVKEEPYRTITYLGGRSLIARVMTDEVDLVCAPLGPGISCLSTGALPGAVSHARTAFRWL